MFLCVYENWDTWMFAKVSYNLPRLFFWDSCLQKFVCFVMLCLHKNVIHEHLQRCLFVVFFVMKFMNICRGKKCNLWTFQRDFREVILFYKNEIHEHLQRFFFFFFWPLKNEIYEHLQRFFLCLHRKFLLHAHKNETYKHLPLAEIFLLSSQKFRFMNICWDFYLNYNIISLDIASDKVFFVFSQKMFCN